MLKIGITERGDPSFDFSWVSKCMAAANGERDLQGAIILTKRLTPRVRESILKIHSAGFPLIVHCNCTGNGSTIVEPNIPAPGVQIQALRDLIDAGFPAKNCVLRIDPIIPTKNGIGNAARVLNWADQLIGLKSLRVRFSVMDDYRHVKARFTAAGLSQVYSGDAFHAPQEKMDAVTALMASFPQTIFYTCGENPAFFKAPNIVTNVGCVSRQDIEIMGLDESGLAAGENPQNRKNCHCITGKTELLSKRGQCPGKCLYCYWR